MNRSMTDNTPAPNVRADAFVAQMRQAERKALVDAIDRQNVAELERAAIAARIREARLEAGLTQEEMAEAVGVIDRTYQNYESVSKPRTPWSLMNQIATITGKSTEWLIHGDRATPDLLNAAKADQVDGGFEEFRGHVHELEERLDRIEQALEQAHIENTEHLRQQTVILERIEILVATLPSDETTRRLLDELRGRGAA